MLEQKQWRRRGLWMHYPVWGTFIAFSVNPSCCTNRGDTHDWPQLLTHPSSRALSLAASQARFRNSLQVIEASESSSYASIASQGASCFRNFALRQVPRMAKGPCTSTLRFEWVISRQNLRIEHGGCSHQSIGGQGGFRCEADGEGRLAQRWPAYS
jgi:hypothetical protein